MHDTAMIFGKSFFQTYTADRRGLTIIDIGAQNINGSLRSAAPPSNVYIGVDSVKGDGVDIVVDDPYVMPFPDGTADVCVSSSCFEHADFFWLLFTEIMRILKPNGLFYLNAPSNGTFHRYPVDCWRFYPDSGLALQKWGQRNGYPCCMLESFVGVQSNDNWNDFVAVFLKDARFAGEHPRRMQNVCKNYTNGMTLERPDLANFEETPEDQKANMTLKEMAQRFFPGSLSR